VREKKAKWLNLAAMASFGTMSLVVKQIPLNSTEIVMERAVIGVLTILVIQLLTKQVTSFRKIKGDLPWLLLSGVALGLGWVLLFEAYRFTTVTVATLAYYFAPTLITVGSAVLLREKMNHRQIGCFIMATVGLVLIIDLRGLTDGGVSGKGIVLALLSAVSYAAVVLTNKKLHTAAGLDRTLVQMGAAALVMLPYVLLTCGVQAFSMGTTGWVALLFLGIFYSGVCYAIYFTTIAHLPGREVALLSYADPLVAVLCSVLILREGITIMQIIGGVILIGFTLYNELMPERKTEKLSAEE
jgi:RarD protein